MNEAAERYRHQTWGEFKDAVEAAGVQDDDDLAYMDCSSAADVRRYQGSDGRWRFRVE